jgi:murein DD-endopeptidase MepM/ murein hydrolase activator NlpD
MGGSLAHDALHGWRRGLRRPILNLVMRRWPLAAIGLVLVLPSQAFAQAEAPYERDSGGSEFGYTEPVVLSASTFRVAPGTVRSGTPVTVSLRVDGATKKVRARIALTPAGGGKAVGGIKLGWVRTGRTVTHSWRPLVDAGSYVAQLRITDRERHPVAPSSQTTASVVVKPKPKPPPPPAVPTSTGTFPIQGDYSFGDDGARFGAKRDGHIHQGQDVFAAEGTPIVSPVSGTVFWRAVQKGGAGHYLVIRGEDGNDYVFMHLVEGSELVDKGDTVTAGQQIGQVGHTGAAEGSHLHFEIWPDGWYADGSEPIDPLPTLQAWASA